MLNFHKKLSNVAKDTDFYLKKFFLNKKKDKSNLITPIKYSIFSGGKRFRSSILVDAGKIFGIDRKKLVIIGAAIECVHSYSLTHDDLPAMDNDDIRRGKLSVHKKFNEFTAILSGNALLTFAFEILSSNNLKLLLLIIFYLAIHQHPDLFSQIFLDIDIFHPILLLIY